MHSLPTKYCNRVRIIIMKEILTIGIGQCGVRLVKNLYDCLLTQHSIDFDGHPTRQLPDHKPSYFECQEEYYRPRCILIDSEPGTIDQVFSTDWGGLLRSQNCPFENQSTGNNFAKGFHSAYDGLKGSIEDSVRRSLERCDSPQSIEMSFSVGGGTGSGLTSALFIHLEDQYPELIKLNYIVIPSGKVSDIVVEPYNSVLSLVNFQGSSHIGNILLSNQSVYKRVKISGQTQINYKNMNEFFTQAMSDITLGNRSGCRNFNCRKLLLASCPYPRTNFLGVSLAAPEQQIDKIKNFRHLFQTRYMLSGISKNESNYFSVQPIIRGDIEDLFTQHSMTQRITKFFDKFKSYLPIKLSPWLQPVVPLHFKETRFNSNQLTQSCVFNSVFIKESLVKIIEDSRQLMMKMCFFHRFQEEGTSQEELNEAINELYSVVQDYEDLGTNFNDCGEESCNSSFCEEQEEGDGQEQQQ